MELFLSILVFVGIAIPINANNIKCGQTPIPPNIPEFTQQPSNFESRIVGGVPAIPHSWPWQVLLFVTLGNKTFTGGGSIIADRWILTAAHVSHGDVQFNDAYVGVKCPGNPGKPLLVQQIHEHPKFNIDTITDDINLIELKDPIEYNEYVQPICLPSADDNVVIPSNTAWVTGWGSVIDGGPNSTDLLQVNVPFVDFGTCDKKLGDRHPLNGTLQVCAGEKGKDACHGDSGGPLVVKNSDGSWFQHGIVSWGDGCGGDTPGVYTRVSGYCDWIEATTRGAAVCHTL